MANNSQYMWWVIGGIAGLVLIIISMIAMWNKKENLGGKSFALDIRPLFRDSDIETMKSFDIDLSNYNTVKSNADKIYSRLTDKDNPMPCDGPWPDSDIQTFKQWMDDGALP